MRLTRYSEYSLRTLIFLGLHRDRLCSIAEIAQSYRISESHLTKVVHALGRHGFIETQRGRNGGIRLARPPAEIGLGEVVRRTEGGLETPDCSGCPLISACKLTRVLSRALQGFLTVLDDYTLEDLLGPGDVMRALLSGGERDAEAEAG